MAVARAEVERIAALARLQLEPDEALRLTHELNDILSHFAMLHAVDVTGVDPFVVATEGAAPLRADEPGADVLHIAPAALASAWREGFFTVPRLAAGQAPEAGAPGP